MSAAGWTRACKCCGVEFVLVARRGRPFEHCEVCRKLNSDQRMKVQTRERLANAKENA